MDDTCTPTSAPGQVTENTWLVACGQRTVYPSPTKQRASSKSIFKSRQPVSVIVPVSSAVMGRDLRVFLLAAFNFLPLEGGARDEDATVIVVRRGTASKIRERPNPPTGSSGRREGFCRYISSKFLRWVNNGDSGSRLRKGHEDGKG
ncbi:unnamed protein product [Cuscuta campestris]|uniref:Uncharacterized protein n=1 Tax=Cuscuta campestris TaxID=132261 RepID=A0A484L5Q7_9ASTE|nr:unnamed protein product [Cuscuta campestris]